MAAVAERSLVSSSLYQEDVFIGGHAAVWGSFFDSETHHWGFACCKKTVRETPCPEAKAAARPKRDADDEEEDAKTKAARRNFWVGKLLDEEPPASLELRESFESAEAFLSTFVLYWFHSWAGGAGAQVKPDAKAVQQTKEALLPLVQQLKGGSLQTQLLSQLADFAELAAKREYALANDVYVAITIGKALWHSHLDLGQQRAHWGGGSQLRTMQKQVVEKDHKNATLFDTDPAVQRYVHALKRLVTHMQCVAPCEDPSKLGHAPAPAALPSEVGLPVQRNIRDTDGQGRVPEFVEPSELGSYAKDNAHRLKFAVESGHSHPFHGIGSARGV